MVRKILARTYIFLVLILMYVPILVLIAYSFSTSQQIGQPLGTFTFKLYGDLFNILNSEFFLIVVVFGL